LANIVVVESLYQMEDGVLLLLCGAVVKMTLVPVGDVVVVGSSRGGGGRWTTTNTEGGINAIGVGATVGALVLEIVVDCGIKILLPLFVPHSLLPPFVWSPVAALS